MRLAIEVGRSRDERPLSRPTVRQVRCPECGADAGENCVGKRGKVRESNHQSRVEAAGR